MQVRQPQTGNPSTSDTLPGMLGSEARAQRIVNLSASERPFAVGGPAEDWLDEASSPLQAFQNPSSSFGAIFAEYSTREANATGSRDFDQAAEENVKQYLAGLPSPDGSAERPFAAGDIVKGWLDRASGPPEESDASVRISSLSELPQGFTPDITGDAVFDLKAEEQTRQFLAGLSSNASGALRPFAAGIGSPGWLEAATSSAVSIHQDV